MRIISPRRCREFWARHPQAERSLRQWLQTVRPAQWNNFADLRSSFPSADLCGKCVIFDVGGRRNYRIIAAIHFNTKRVFIRHVLTHAEYMKGDWKPECDCS